MRPIVGRWLVGAAVLVGLGAWWWQPVAAGKSVRVRTAHQPAEPLWAPTALPAHDKLMGVATCASMACHHGNGPRGSQRSEYSTWIGSDKHAQAFQVLYNERSERIARNLYGPKARAHEQQLCLNCHSMQHEKAHGHGPRFLLGDGVGCESCHGPAERWLHAHYQAGFKEKSAAQKAKLGMWDTKDLAVRAGVCADCHIGNLDKGMEVNHDLIAAGHPRLNFEYAGYLHMMPRHWLLADEKERHPDFHARVWALGQVVSARAAVEQSRFRAAAADKPGKAGKPWPEFSEYDCFACHKDLQVDSPRQRAGYQGRHPGALPYGTWYLPLIQRYATLTGVDLDRPETSVTRLKELMEKPGAPPVPVAEHAGKVVGALDGWLGRLRRSDPLTSAEIRKLLRSLAAVGAKEAGALDWDETAQLYLALAALNTGLADLDPRHRDRPVRQDLRAVGLRLRQAFPPGFDSPRLFDPTTPRPLDERFRDIRGRLSN